MKSPVAVTLLFATAVLAAAACTHSATTAAPPTQTIVNIGVDRPQAAVLRAPEEAGHEDLVVTASRTAVLNALVAAYSDLGIEVRYSNPQTSELGNRNFAKIHTIAGEPLSKFLDCGMTPTGPAASSYRITMSMLSMAVPDSAGIRVETRLQARATDFGVSTEPRDCRSLGTLEGRLHNLVKTKLMM